MKKIRLIIFLFMLCITHSAAAQLVIAGDDETGNKQILATSFYDYEPFAALSVSPKTVFDNALELFAKENHLTYIVKVPENYKTAVNQVRQGAIDLLVGSYYGTKQYSGLEFIYPAVLHNPIHVIMLPDNISKISTIDDLVKLKGAYVATEHFSDYMIHNFQNNGIVAIENSYKAYEALFTGQIDYIIGSYYYNYVYTLQTGLTPYVSFSKNALWNMPLFLSVSKASANGVSLKSALVRFMETESFKQAVSQSLEKHVHELEAKYQGVVPPKFVRTASLNELTPADEELIRTATEE